MPKPKKMQVEAPEHLAEMRTQTTLAMEAASETLPWWMPKDLDARAAILSDDMIAGLDDKTYFALKHNQVYKGNNAKLKEMVTQVILSMMNSQEYRLELAKWALLKPLEVLKIMGAQLPKNVTLDGDLKVSHTIVVPSTTSHDDWNSAHQARRDLGGGDWGVSLDETPFGRNTLEGDVNGETPISH